MNKLTFNADKIIFEGFEELKSYITFAFYPNGIAIFDGQKEDYDHYYSAQIINHEISIDEELEEYLKRYDLNSEIFFVYSGNKDKTKACYLEMSPTDQK